MRFGLPRDPAQFVALFAALAALFLATRLLRPAKTDRLFVALSAAAAALLSAAYVPLYLRGGPRIIDATSYFLEARALAEGHFSFPLDEPVHSTLGRFLVRSDGPTGTSLAVLFPPGYPALLALGFLIGSPLAVGPLLAAAITIATYALAKRALPEDSPLAGNVSLPRLATLLSVACAALRYHCADTMSHGLAALCVTAALALAFEAKSRFEAGESARLPLLAAGFFLGWLVATRPFSALALALPMALLLARGAAPKGKTMTLVALGALPGIALLLLHQRAATGALFTSSQKLYYAVSDGPPGCFRYGFGAGIGCVGEHGDFVAHNLPNGYGPYAAIATTARRLKQHLVDAGNAEPFFLLVVAGAVLAAKRPGARLLTLAVAGQILAYAPFYFDGNYPGGGARFFADVLPLEHVLAALAILHLAARLRASRRAFAVSALVALVPLGFAFRAGFDHAALRDREGGLPMFEPARLEALPKRALVFVDTDHGFSLGFDPNGKDRMIRRFHGDALDRFTWESLGEPPAFRYLFPIPPSGAGLSEPRLVPYPIDLAAPLVIEGENLWPPLAQDRAYALPRWASGTCASSGRWLAVTRTSPNEPGSITLSLPAPHLAGRSIAPRLGLVGPAMATITLALDGRQTKTWRLSEPGPAHEPRCLSLAPMPIPPGTRSAALTIVHEPPSDPAVEPSLALDALGLVEIENH